MSSTKDEKKDTDKKESSERTRNPYSRKLCTYANIWMVLREFSSDEPDAPALTAPQIAREIRRKVRIPHSRADSHRAARHQAGKKGDPR